MNVKFEHSLLFLTDVRMLLTLTHLIKYDNIAL